jgi:hypothetical protein
MFESCLSAEPAPAWVIEQIGHSTRDAPVDSNAICHIDGPGSERDVDLTDTARDELDASVAQRCHLAWERASPIERERDFRWCGASMVERLSQQARDGTQPLGHRLMRRAGKPQRPVPDERSQA